ncbi:MAG: ATP-dependent DNA helicase RecG [Flavobacteriales bacterium]|nr:ATP-dependent DNA helicase RecG [Flavobacteriales bacterium]
MSNHFLDTPIEFLKGVGPNRSEVLKKELKIFTFRDLLFHFPFRYEDRTKIYKIKEIVSEQYHIQLIGKIEKFDTIGIGNAKRISAIFSDDTGKIELVWFKGLKWIKNSIKTGEPYIIYGKPSLFQKYFNIVHPEMEELKEDTLRNLSGFQSVYSTTEKLIAKGFTSRGIFKLQRTLCLQLQGKVQEYLPAQILKSLQLVSLEQALINIHIPHSNDELMKARLRLKFDELFLLQLKILKEKGLKNEFVKGFIFTRIGEYFNTFYNQFLPFELTNAQKRVLKEIRKDTATGKQMNRLLQGDVGSGKTMVAFMSILMALDNGFQACFMAPTEILASQHFETIKQLAAPLNISVALLTGSTKKSERNILLNDLAEGNLQVIIGTHALIEDTVVFKNLGLVIVDEQHRFGVEQRARLWKKNTSAPHILVMTATPIPRTLAMTFYGDLDVSIIDELPPGRKEIKTQHFYESARLKVFGFIEQQVKLGRQIYVVYPLIDESEKMDIQHLMKGYDTLLVRFPPPNFLISIVHGKLKPIDKEYQMQLFVTGKSQIMVATTVIEVGVNVPNASVMIIENAERFGLSQLHQLRGRVGRGAEQSYCILLTGNKLTTEAKLRIETMTRTNDGFEIADVDLKLRGPGDIQGTQQSGLMNFKIADLTKDATILNMARNTAQDLLKSDSDLNQTEHLELKKQLLKIYKETNDWSRIS